MKITLLCLVLYVPLALCIMGGYNRDKAHSFVVSIRDDWDVHFCSGAIITRRFVVTAATCVKGKKIEDLRLVGGINKLNDTDDREDFNIEKIHLKDPTGRSDVHNNIALLRLTYNFHETHFVRPIRMAYDYDDPQPKEGDRCEIYGWGQKYHDQPELTNTIQWAIINISSLSTCRAHNKDVDESNVCSNGGSSLCKFDTGNPLVSYDYYFLWGIATEQHSCGNATVEDVYTRLDFHKKWIQEVLNEYSESISTWPWPITEPTNSSTVHEPQITIVMGILVLQIILLK